MGWSLFEEGREQKPLVFSNGKTQEDVVNEVIESIRRGHKVIFIKGVCGTGKSAIALNLAKEFGRASVVVPIKNLQKQYEEDYTNKKYLLKSNGEKLKIKVITGRSNHKCPFIQENPEDFEPEKVFRSERNSKLNDFWKRMTNKVEEKEDFSCDNNDLPCKVQIMEKNRRVIRRYLEKNNKLNFNDFSSIKNVKRMSIAPVCPYWSPIVPADVSLSIGAEKKNYEGLENVKYSIYQRKKGCSYYDQFESYVNADTLIFNSEKYKIETLMNRKPATDIEIIDECDEFLDSLSNEKIINFNRLGFALGSVFSEKVEMVNEITRLTDEIMHDKVLETHAFNREIIPLKNSKINELLKIFLDSDFMNNVECDEENYCYHLEEVARTFRHFVDETYLSFEKEDDKIIAKLVTINLEKRFKEMLDKNKAIVMMSGTIHSEKVLKDIFGLENFKIIEAETKTPGKITKISTGVEFNCKYENFRENRISRKHYFNVLSDCIDMAKKPLLIHVNSFNDLPTDMEAEGYGLKIMTKEKLLKMQSEDKVGKIVQDFKDGKKDILYTTRCGRGIDFPGSMCNSIIITKFPYPNVGSLFLKILKLTKPRHYTEFYLDKARREFLQKIYRGLRSEKDHIYLLSPDIRVLDMDVQNIR